MTKKSVPKHVIGTAPQNVLWKEEVDRAKKTPDPLRYNPSYKQIENDAKGGRNGMGFDIKSTAKPI